MTFNVPVDLLRFLDEKKTLFPQITISKFVNLITNKNSFNVSMYQRSQFSYTFRIAFFGKRLNEVETKG